MSRAKWHCVVQIQSTKSPNFAAGSCRGAAAPIRLGFVPLNDSAPIIIAREMGFFEKHALNVKLYREAGWATIRDKIVYGELDAAHALGTMPVSISFGLNSIPCPCLTGLILNLNGNAITLSQALWNRGVRDG